MYFYKLNIKSFDNVPTRIYPVKDFDQLGEMGTRELNKTCIGGHQPLEMYNHNRQVFRVTTYE